MVNADFRVRPQLDPHHPVDLCNSCGLTRHVEIIQKREQPLPVLQLSCDRPQCPLLTQAEQQRHQCVALLTTFSLTDGADTVSKRSLDCLTTGTRLKARDIRLVARRTLATATTHRAPCHIRPRRSLSGQSEGYLFHVDPTPSDRF